MLWKKIPPADTELPPMTHEKCLEILGQLEQGIYTSNDPDVKTALAMAKAALIADKLNLER